MNPVRFLVLALGPLAVIAIAYVIAFPRPSTANSVLPTPPPVMRSVSKNATKNFPPNSNGTVSITESCQQVSHRLRKLLPGNYHFVVRPPFVIAGDLPENRLKSLYADIIDPVSSALRIAYFERSPTQPVSIVICSTEVEFRRLAREWDGHLEGGYHGYYQRDKRRILLDLEAGNGSLAHELTHALSQADCEQLPEWFDEGLGALHEDATFSPSHAGLMGVRNWRCRVTQRARTTGQLPSFEELMKPGGFRSGNVEIRYAMARSLCMFLQSQHMLVDYYKALRNRPSDDASGLKTLNRILSKSGVRAAEKQFQEWVERTSL